MEFRLLGEVELCAAGRMLHVGAPRPQAVLAVLAVDARRPVAIETLIDRVWDDAPPVEARNVVYSHLSRIRRLLRQAAALTGETTARIERRHAGYVLDIDPDLVDLHRFRRLAGQNSDPLRCDRARVTALAEALSLWRGSPLAGLPGSWAAQVRDSWERRRLNAVVQWAQIELRLGHPAAVINTLPDLAAEYPLVEPLETVLMSALYATGRCAEALDRYTAVRKRLADELGTDPGPELRALHQAMLHGELPPPPAAPVAAAGTTVPPASRQPEPVASTSDGRVAAEHDALAPDPAGKSRSFDASCGRGAATATATPLARMQPRLTGRRRVLAAVAAVVLLAAIVLVPILHRDKKNEAPSIEHVQALFATAQKLDREGKVKDAQETTVGAVQLYDKLIKLNPNRNAPPLAPAIIAALRRAGVDFSVAEAAMNSWAANPTYTPYPAISQMLLLQGWRLKAPVYLDVIVGNYEQAPGVTSPRDVADVRPDVLKTAILEGSTARYGTQATDFAQLLKP